MYISKPSLQNTVYTLYIRLCLLKQCVTSLRLELKYYFVFYISEYLKNINCWIKDGNYILD